jgi:hypothetical protein
MAPKVFDRASNDSSAPRSAAMPVFGSTEDRSIAESACARYLSICFAACATDSFSDASTSPSLITVAVTRLMPATWLARSARKALTFASSSDAISATVRYTPECVCPSFSCRLLRVRKVSKLLLNPS